MHEMINSIYLVSFLEPSGPISQANNIVTALKGSDVNAVIVTLFPEKEQSWLDKFRIQGLEIIQLNCGKFSFFSARNKLMRVIKERDIKVVHAAGVRAVITASLLPKTVKTIMTARSHMKDLEEKENGLVNKIAQWLFKGALGRIDVRAACSKSLARDLKRETGLDFIPVQNGVDSEKFKPADKEMKMALRKKLAIPEEGFVFISCAVLFPRKNMSLLINTFNRLDRCDYILLIVGEGEEWDKLRALAKDNPHIVFTGKKSNVEEYYMASDVFVSSSLAEGLPNTVIEAMACGLPCVLSNIGPHEEILKYNQNAGLIANLEKDDWCEEIEKVFTWDLEEKSSKARAIIDNHLSKKCMARRYAELYQN